MNFVHRIEYLYKIYPNLYGMCNILIINQQSMGIVEYRFNTKTELEKDFPFYYEKT